jgi:hypothetical protein
MPGVPLSWNGTPVFARKGWGARLWGVSDDGGGVVLEPGGVGAGPAYGIGFGLCGGIW